VSTASLDQLSEALRTASGRTPLEVIDAFCPVGRKIGPFSLVPLRAGHDLFLSRVNHPLAQGHGAAWAPQDVAIALFAFTRPSAELFEMIENDTFEVQFHAFLDEIPLGGVETAAADLLAHWIRSRATALPMSNPNVTGSKKKAASAGGSR
jgi:hypothetical protein